MPMPAAPETLPARPAPFDAVAGVYDDVFSDSPIGLAQRQAVWRELDRVFRSGQRILEINCGTGIDALHLAGRGVEVFGCDSAPRMVARARQRSRTSSDRAPVRFRCLPTEELGQMVSEGPYDGVLSNFAGLNCVSDLHAVVGNLARLVRPGGSAVVCVFGVFSLWEVLWHASRGDFRRAFRRFERRGLEVSLSPGATVTVHYRPVGSLRRAFAPYFQLERWSGVGIASPPSYARSIPARFPGLFRIAVKADSLFGGCPGIRSLADHAVLVLRRTGERDP